MKLSCLHLCSIIQIHTIEKDSFGNTEQKKGKRKVQGVPQLQAAAHRRHQEEEDTDKTKQAQIEPTYEKH